MTFTDRQKQILNSTVLEYINSAQPISSQVLEEKYDFGVSPATIRNEMQFLTEKGFLAKPHISSGRVPTDKGYRFFVNELSEEEEGKEFLDFEQELQDYLKATQLIARQLALLSSNLAFIYLSEENLLWKEGWESILEEPEFGDKEYTTKLTRFLRDFESVIADIQPERVEIYIGRENPFSRVKEFSIVMTGCLFRNNQRGLVSIIGPKRMAYQKNIALMNSLDKLLV